MCAIGFGSTLHYPVEVFASKNVVIEDPNSGGGSKGKKADKVMHQPKIHIDNKGKLSIVGPGGKVQKKESLVTQTITKYRVVIAGISGIGAVSMILFFILNFIKLGAMSSNPEGRSRAVMGLILSGVAAAGLGAVTFVVGIFFNAL